MPLLEPARIVDYEDRHQDAFRALNIAWISRYFVVEDSDRKALDDPESGILRGGGCILMAEDDDSVVGCVALIREDAHTFELAKMAVDPSAQGRGIGALLGRAAIDRARTLGARRVELLSNRSLAPAMALYRKLGFVEVPLGHVDYQRADIRMAIDL